MTREEAIQVLQTALTSPFIYGEYADAISMTIKALEDIEKWRTWSHTYDNLISRQDAIRWVKTECNPYGKPTLDFESGKRVIEHLEQMPSADRPTGKWIKSNLLPNGWHCSHCDSPIMTDDIDEMLFCPNCGAEMGGESDG